MQQDQLLAEGANIAPTYTGILNLSGQHRTLIGKAKQLESLEIQQFAEPLDDVEFGAVDGQGDKDRFWIISHFPESEIDYKYIPEEDTSQQEQDMVPRTVPKTDEASG